MYLLAGQHPYLGVLMVLPVPRFLNALSAPVSVSHLLPHNVRLNPLSRNTEITREVKMYVRKKVAKIVFV